MHHGASWWLGWGSLVGLSMLPVALAGPHDSGGAGPRHGDWAIEVVDSSGYVGEGATLALDELGRAHIACSAYREPALRYEVETPHGRSVEVVDTTTFTFPGCLRLDRHSSPCLSYYFWDYYAGGQRCYLMYAERIAGQWRREAVDGPHPSLGCYSGLAIDSDGQPHISYYAGAIEPRLDQDAIRYAHRTAAGWTTEFVDSGVATRTSIALDHSGIPHIAYTGHVIRSGGMHYAIKYASRISGHWVTEVADSEGGLENMLVLDSRDRPCIVYSADAGRQGHIQFARRIQGRWLIETVDPMHLLSQFPSLALDSHDVPHVSYFESETHALRFAVKRDRWRIETVESPSTTPMAGTRTDHAHTRGGWLATPSRALIGPGDVGTWTSLALDPSGHDVIAYVNYGDPMLPRLMLARRGDVAPDPDHGPGPLWSTSTYDVDPDPARVDQQAHFRVLRMSPGHWAVHYVLTQAGPVRLQVFDIMGRAMLRPSESWRTSGPHEEALEVEGLRPGAYLCRLTTPDRVVYTLAMELP